MKRSAKHASTSNEFLARKKNVSEEVKLREALASLDCRISLTKDAMRQDVGKVKSDLRQLRRSTGHSIEALPPTPFRLMARQNSVMPAPPGHTQDLILPSVSPEFQYMLDDISGERGDMDTNSKDLQSMIENSLNTERLMGTISKAELVRSVTFLDAPDEFQTERSKITESSSGEQGTSVENTFRFPQLSSQVRPNADTVNSIDKDLLTVPNQVIKHPQVSSVTLPQLVNFQRESSESSLSQRSTFKQSSEPSQLELYSEDSRLGDFESPVSKRLLSILNEGEWKRREYVRKNSIAGFDSFTAQLLARREMNTSTGIESSSRRGANTHVTSTSRTEEWRGYRDARARCRTCMNRFRQNAAFQRQKLEQEAQAKNQVDRKSSIGKIASQRRSSPSFDSDIEANWTDDVLDFDCDEEKHKIYTTRKKDRRKGYSRTRLNELAEPRKGTKRKTLFAKRIISKEVDTLTQTHDQPQLTDREKERLRMLESKVRTFLATMQQTTRPASMVHIPQREDIMRVDISHH